MAPECSALPAPSSCADTGLLLEATIAENTRTQEFVLRWSADTERSFREIVRQQWNFSQPNAVRETQEYAVEIPGVKTLELVIVPDIKGGSARASLRNLRLG